MVWCIVTLLTYLCLFGLRCGFECTFVRKRLRVSTGLASERPLDGQSLVARFILFDVRFHVHYYVSHKWEWIHERKYFCCHTIIFVRLPNVWSRCVFSTVTFFLRFIEFYNFILMQIYSLESSMLCYGKSELLVNLYFYYKKSYQRFSSWNIFYIS